MHCHTENFWGRKTMHRVSQAFISAPTISITASFLKDCTEYDSRWYIKFIIHTFTTEEKATRGSDHERKAASFSFQVKALQLGSFMKK